MPTPTSFKDAQALNNIDRNVRQYKDLDLFFVKKKLSSKDRWCSNSKWCKI